MDPTTYKPSVRSLRQAIDTLDESGNGKCVTATDYFCRALGILLVDFLAAALKKREEEHDIETKSRFGPNRKD